MDGDKDPVVTSRESRDDAFRAEREITVWMGEPNAVAGKHEVSDSTPFAPAVLTKACSLEPALPAEEAEQAAADGDHHRDDDPESGSRAEAGEVDVHPEDAR